MKLHLSIAAAEELRERRGGSYVLYSVCLEGFLLGKARCSQLCRWDAQLRQLFGSAVPGFPPKFHLVMTKWMADERRSQLEQYLQNVTLNSNITSSDLFIGFFQKLPLVTSCKMGLSRELIKYYSLFFFQDHDDGALSVLKKVADFELPYVSLQSMKELHCKLGIRKWYMDPSLDTLLMGRGASLNLLYMQFLELIRKVQFYGYVWLDPCTCDYAEEGCSADICVGNNEINCCIKLPTNQTKEGVTKHGEEDTLELRFEYNDSGTWQWITLYTKQAFVLSNCLKKIISEQMMKAAKEGQEMEIQMSKSMKNRKKSTIQQKQVIHSGFISRKKNLVRPSEEDGVFEKVREEGL